MADNRAPEYGRHQEKAPNQQPVLNETEARQAKPLGVMRYVLTISLALVIIGFAIVYVIHRG